MVFSSQTSYVVVQKQRGFETMRRTEIEIGEEKLTRRNNKNNISKMHRKGK